MPPSIKTAESPVVELLNRMIGLIDELSTVMDEEIPLVEERRTAEHAELLKRKQRLTLDYRSSLKTIALQPDLLKQAPADLRAKAQAAADKLAEASERNGRVLRAVITASQRLVQSIVSIVKDEVLPKSGYGHLASATAYSPTCQPVSVMRSV